MSIREDVRERTALLASVPANVVPAAEPRTVEIADAIASGTIFFYGITTVEIGLSGVDWTGMHIQHQEWPAQLNRFMYLGPLASAYGATADEKYARAARGYIEDWIAAGDYLGRSECRTRDNTLNLSIRMGSSVHAGWGGVLHAFLDSPSFDDDFLRTVFRSLDGQAEFLMRNLSPINNWRISQLDALTMTALRFPWLEYAAPMLECGRTGLRNALATQFLPDGVHSERTAGYHSWMTRVAENYCLLGRTLPEADVNVRPDIVRKALDYAVHGVLCGINDATAPHTDSRTDALIVRRGEFLAAAGLPVSDPPPDQVFPDAGQAFARSGFEDGAEYLAFDASTWGGAHCHLSRLGFAYRFGGRMLIADPGILDYEMSNPYASYGKSTRAHSTVNVNGLNQSDTDASLLNTVFSERACLFHGLYEGGYWRNEFFWGFRDGRGPGVFGRHERVLFLLRGRYLLLLDTVNTDDSAPVHNCFQMGPMDGWSHDGSALSWWSENDDVNILLQALAVPEGTSIECFDGSEDPLRGWVGVHGNDHVHAPLVQFTYPGDPGRPGVSTVLLAAPFASSRPEYSVTDSGDAIAGYGHYLSIAGPGGTVDHVGWTKDLVVPVEHGPFMTDATFVWCRTAPDGAPRECFVLNGTYLRFRGEVLFHSEGLPPASGIIPITAAGR
ncbi:MAG: heparinase II/III family protein [Planctomycetes bacterium]|nr:heparinase II/III family protein [Planctomycetota bacterium]